MTSLSPFSGQLDYPTRLSFVTSSVRCHGRTADPEGADPPGQG